MGLLGLECPDNVFNGLSTNGAVRVSRVHGRLRAREAHAHVTARVDDRLDAGRHTHLQIVILRYN